MTAKPFTKIVDYTAQDLEDAIDQAVDTCKANNYDFWVILRGIDAYFEKRHRKLNPAATRITSWQGDHSTGEGHGAHTKQKFPRQSSPDWGATSGGSTERPLQQRTYPADADPESPTPALGSERPRGPAEPRSPQDEVPGPGRPNTEVPDGRRNSPRKRGPSAQRTS